MEVLVSKTYALTALCLLSAACGLVNRNDATLGTDINKAASQETATASDKPASITREDFLDAENEYTLDDLLMKYAASCSEDSSKKKWVFISNESPDTKSEYGLSRMSLVLFANHTYHLVLRTQAYMTAWRHSRGDWVAAPNGEIQFTHKDTNGLDDPNLEGRFTLDSAGEPVIILTSKKEKSSSSSASYVKNLSLSWTMKPSWTMEWATRRKK